MRRIITSEEKKNHLETDERNKGFIILSDAPSLISLLPNVYKLAHLPHPQATSSISTLLTSETLTKLLSLVSSLCLFPPKYTHTLELPSWISPVLQGGYLKVLQNSCLSLFGNLLLPVSLLVTSLRHTPLVFEETGSRYKACLSIEISSKSRRGISSALIAVIDLKAQP